MTEAAHIDVQARGVLLRSQQRRGSVNIKSEKRVPQSQTEALDWMGTGRTPYVVTSETPGPAYYQQKPDFNFVGPPDLVPAPRSFLTKKREAEAEAKAKVEAAAAEAEAKEAEAEQKRKEAALKRREAAIAKAAEEEKAKGAQENDEGDDEEDEDQQKVQGGGGATGKGQMGSSSTQVSKCFATLNQPDT
jgi:nucleoid-associated protein YgaU